MVVSTVPEPVGDRKRSLETGDSWHPSVVRVRPNRRRARHDPRHHFPRHPSIRPSRPHPRPPRPHPRSSVTQTPVQCGPSLWHRLRESNPSRFLVVILRGVRLADQGIGHRATITILNEQIFCHRKQIYSPFLQTPSTIYHLPHTYIHIYTAPPHKKVP